MVVQSFNNRKEKKTQINYGGFVEYPNIQLLFTLSLIDLTRLFWYQINIGNRWSSLAAYILKRNIERKTEGLLSNKDGVQFNVLKVNADCN